MSEAKVVDRKPMVVKIEAGSYWWCACGHSQNQPYCDGSHRDTDILPVKFELTEPGTKALCMCKRTEGQPFCDGAHSLL